MVGTRIGFVAHMPHGSEGGTGQKEVGGWGVTVTVGDTERSGVAYEPPQRLIYNATDGPDLSLASRISPFSRGEKIFQRLASAPPVTVTREFEKGKALGEYKRAKQKTSDIKLRQSSRAFQNLRKISWRRHRYVAYAGKGSKKRLKKAKPFMLDPIISPGATQSSKRTGISSKGGFHDQSKVLLSAVDVMTSLAMVAGLAIALLLHPLPAKSMEEQKGQ